ncbi:DUF1801 domain-containing protein [Pedobacter sp. G11]|uniref:DUF1801 domain-containing protein n=1 Tax=Pedobacter sp. G11 TaxID=2482728 RepID=UPI000F5ED7DF|nr:DUF1801 domain-containing protein [Pedobacter sp. G11]AZI26239.1 DUF1801 domain-containing protein [Pedobacter sp. G11]
MAVKKTKLSGNAEVDHYMSQLVHPHKTEIALLRSIIIDANSKLEERIKWNAPSFFYQKDMAAFNLRAKGYVQIIFIFYDGNMLHEPSILQGEWKDRREARFYNLDDIEGKKPALEQFINKWIELIEGETN